MILLAWVSGAVAQGGYREERAIVALSSGQTVVARLRFPPTDERPLPAVMLFGGFQGAARVLDHVQTPEPIVFATFDYPFDAPRKFVFPDSLKLAPQMKAAIHGTLDGVGRLYQLLRSHPDIDPQRITVAGASAGAPLATVAAANHRIPGLVVVHGFGELRRVIAHQFARKFEQSVHPLVARAAAWPLAWFCVWYTGVPAPEEYAVKLAAGQRVLMVSAAEDSFVPLRSSDALWQALQRSAATREHLRLPGDHVGRSEQEMAGILEQALHWLRRNDLAGPGR
jgi:poly(3-hydroxybutyrate) depolymerase